MTAARVTVSVALRSATVDVQVVQISGRELTLVTPSPSPSPIIIPIPIIDASAVSELLFQRVTVTAVVAVVTVRLIVLTVSAV